MDATWTPRDLEILEALTLKVRIFTLRQIASAWWNEGKHQLANARRRLTVLSSAGLLDRYVINAHPLIPLPRPVSTWLPGDEHPDVQAISWKLQRRWTKPSQPTTTFVATKKSANLFASYAGTPPSVLQVSHDLHQSAVYLSYRRQDPELAQRWLGEDALTKAGYGVKDPDAYLLDDDGSPFRVVEFGGKYDARRVRDFHDHCEERSLAYELW